MIAQLDNGKEVLLPDPVEIGVDPSYDLAMVMPGAIFKDTERQQCRFAFGQDYRVCGHRSREEFLVEIPTDHEGNFSTAPSQRVIITTELTLTMVGTTSTRRCLSVTKRQHHP